MIREYVANSQWNKVFSSTHPKTGKTVCFVRGIIRVDGKDRNFVGTGRTTMEAQKHFDSFLDPNCICVNGSDLQKCPVHKV